MPSDITPVPAHLSMVNGEVSTPSSGATPEGSFVMAGGMEWENAPIKCVALNKNGWPCSQKPVANTPYCLGHLRQRRVAEREHVSESP